LILNVAIPLAKRWFTLSSMLNQLLNARSTYFSLFRCGQILATPTGGKLALRDGVHIRRKAD
jgi:hypothetical protein